PLETKLEPDGVAGAAAEAGLLAAEGVRVQRLAHAADLAAPPALRQARAAAITGGTGTAPPTDRQAESAGARGAPTPPGGGGPPATRWRTAAHSGRTGSPPRRGASPLPATSSTTKAWQAGGM